MIKALEFNVKPKHSSSFVAQRLEEENSYRGWYHSLGVIDLETGRNRSYSTEMEIMNELQISLEQIDLRKIAKTHIVDDDYAVMARYNTTKCVRVKPACVLYGFAALCALCVYGGRGGYQKSRPFEV